MIVVGERKPLLATGDIVEDYLPLFYYIDVAVELGRSEAKDSILIKSADFEKVKELVSSSTFTLAQLVDSLVEYVRHRVDPEVAVAALSRYLKHQVSEDYAITFYSRLVSCWIVEAASSLNIIRLK